MKHAQLGGGGFWPGVPANLPAAELFFRACGWDYSETTYDLVADVTTYETPSVVVERTPRQVDIHVVTQNEISEILAFENREFPSWAGYFKLAADVGDEADILGAWIPGKGVVGSLISFSPQSSRIDTNGVWTTLLGDDLGGLGAVGVAAGERNRGIGSALVARGSEILRDRGVRRCLVDWTSLVGFYGRLGYVKWREYRMSWRDLPLERPSV